MKEEYDFIKYENLAKEYGMINAKIITPDEIVFDIRAILKCKWGCVDYSKRDIRCHNRDTTYEERVAMVKKYNHILLLHSHNATDISSVSLKIEEKAFVDGYYYAFALRCCNLCNECGDARGNGCKFPEKIRPCEQSFGVDIYKTVRNVGLPCDVLKDKESIPNRYGFVLLD